MAFEGTCDLCHRELKSPAELGELFERFRIPGVVEHTCGGCVKKVEEQLKKINDFYGKDIANDMREWLLNENKKPHKSRILTK